MNIAIYLRVSTEKQDYENQLMQLKEYCKKQGWNTYKIYSETISGKESERPIFKEMMKDASQKKFDAILVWALDRFTREGVAKAWYYISQLNIYGTKFFSFTEPYFNTDNKFTRDILFSIMATLAEQERLRISERTKAGLQRAKAMGKKIGKPPVPEKIKQLIIDLREQGKSYREICKEVYYWDSSKHKKQVSMGFVHKTLSSPNAKNFRK